MSDPIAIFQYSNGKRVALKPTDGGGLYIEYLDYEGIFHWGKTKDCNITTLGMWQDGILCGDMLVIQSPHNLYHVWHVCMCDECVKHDGRIFSHSQSAWDEHMRYVSSDRVFTFPTVGK